MLKISGMQLLMVAQGLRDQIQAHTQHGSSLKNSGPVINP